MAPPPQDASEATHTREPHKNKTSTRLPPKKQKHIRHKQERRLGSMEAQANQTKKERNLKRRANRKLSKRKRDEVEQATAEERLNAARETIAQQEKHERSEKFRAHILQDSNPTLEVIIERVARIVDNKEECAEMIKQIKAEDKAHRAAMYKLYVEHNWPGYKVEERAAEIIERRRTLGILQDNEEGGLVVCNIVARHSRYLALPESEQNGILPSAPHEASKIKPARSVNYLTFRWWSLQNKGKIRGSPPTVVELLDAYKEYVVHQLIVHQLEENEMDEASIKEKKLSAQRQLLGYKAQLDAQNAAARVNESDNSRVPREDNQSMAQEVSDHPEIIDIDSDTESDYIVEDVNSSDDDEMELPDNSDGEIPDNDCDLQDTSDDDDSRSEDTQEIGSHDDDDVEMLDDGDGQIPDDERDMQDIGGDHDGVQDTRVGGRHDKEAVASYKPTAGPRRDSEIEGSGRRKSERAARAFKAK